MSAKSNKNNRKINYTRIERIKYIWCMKEHAVVYRAMANYFANKKCFICGTTPHLLHLFITDKPEEFYGEIAKLRFIYSPVCESCFNRSISISNYIEDAMRILVNEFLWFNFYSPDYRHNIVTRISACFDFKDEYHIHNSYTVDDSVIERQYVRFNH